MIEKIDFHLNYPFRQDLFYTGLFVYMEVYMVNKTKYKITYNIPCKAKYGLVSRIELYDGFDRKDNVQKDMAKEWRVNFDDIVITNIEEI